jgi:hypothetical protein
MNAARRNMKRAVLLNRPARQGRSAEELPKPQTSRKVVGLSSSARRVVLGGQLGDRLGAGPGVSLQ